MLLAARLAAAADDDYVQAIKTFLHQNVDPQKAATVIGLVDRHGSEVISWGRLGNGAADDVNGDSVFFIGSVSKTFTALLLLEMAARGEVELEDPVAKYLPKSVKMPTHGGRQITLLHLATHTAGFPINPDNMSGKDDKERYESYTADKMYAFLSGYALTRDPGGEFEYSNIGMALLGHVLALRAGADFESLIVDRIARPLQMASTGITLSERLRSRLAMGHDDSGRPSAPWTLQAYAPVGSILSTANDLLKYAAANAGLTPSRLSALMEKSHAIRQQDLHGMPDVPGFGLFGRTAMDWADRAALEPSGMDLLAHAGGAGSYHAFVGFDMKQQRGVVVLTTANDIISVEATGWTILQRRALTPESAKQFARELAGIGAALDLDQLTQSLRITKVFPKSPAAVAGLASGMTIRKINAIPVADKSLGECMQLLRGDVGTKVRLEVLDLAGRTSLIEVIRQKFTIQP